MQYATFAHKSIIHITCFINLKDSQIRHINAKNENDRFSALRGNNNILFITITVTQHVSFKST